jgi:hypothetical protein
MMTMMMMMASDFSPLQSFFESFFVDGDTDDVDFGEVVWKVGNEKVFCSILWNCF